MTFGMLCLLLTATSWMFCSGLEERLVLHSDTDIAQEITEMKALLERQNQSIQALTVTVTTKDSELAQLKTEFQSLANVVKNKDSAIAQLNASRDQDITQLKAQLHANELEMAKIKSDFKSTYVRWGKSTCPGNGSSLVYTGYMAGGQLNQEGSGSNYLCLADTPNWNYFDDTHGYGGVRGVEYQFSAHLSDMAKFFGTNIRDDDAPCAVCETNRAANIMIPGTDLCYGGWTKEYSGYLVSGAPGHKHQYEYVCLDARPDTLPGSHASDDNAILYISEVDCGSSSLCPPYVQGRELTCVVCSV